MFIKVTEIRDGKCLSFPHYVNLVQHNVIKCMLPLDTSYTRLEEEKKKFYDWFLPKQKAFAEQWNLYVNSD